MNRPLIAVGLALTLGLVGWLVVGKEGLLEDGRVVLLELAPVDPRSLMQGDYMILRYAIANEIRTQTASARSDAWPDDGNVILRLDEKGVGRLVDLDRGQSLEDGQVRLRYRRRGSVRLGAESYFFEEGTASIYEAARYGALRVAVDGESLLIGLHGEDLKPLGVAAR